MKPQSVSTISDLFKEVRKKGSRIFLMEPEVPAEWIEKVQFLKNEILDLVGDFIDHDEAFRRDKTNPLLTWENVLFFINNDIHETLNYIAAADGKITPEESAFIKEVVGFGYGEKEIFSEAEALDREMMNEESGKWSVIIYTLGYYAPDAAERYIELLKKIGEIMVTYLSPQGKLNLLLCLYIYWKQQYRKARTEYLEIQMFEKENDGKNGFDNCGR